MYQIVVGGLFLLNVPVSYIILKIVQNPFVPFLVSIVVTFSMSCAKVVFFKCLGHISIRTYMCKVILPVFVVSSLTVVFDSLLLNPAESFVRLIMNVLFEVCIISVLILRY